MDAQGGLDLFEIWVEHTEKIMRWQRVNRLYMSAEDAVRYVGRWNQSSACLSTSLPGYDETSVSECIKYSLAQHAGLITAHDASLTM